MSAFASGVPHDIVLNQFPTTCMCGNPQLYVTLHTCARVQVHFLFGGNRIFNFLTAEEEELLLREDENGDVTPNHAGSEQQQEQNARPAIRTSTEVFMTCTCIAV